MLHKHGVRSFFLPLLGHTGGIARSLRLECKGALYQVTSRGDGREDIFLSDGDRLRFLEILGDVWERFNWKE